MAVKVDAFAKALESFAYLVSVDMAALHNIGKRVKVLGYVATKGKTCRLCQ